MNARELVDAYAKRSIFQGTEDDPYPEPSVQPHEPYAPLAFAALRAVLDNCDFIDCLIGQYKPYEIARMIRAAITTALET